MPASTPQPTFGRVASILWFPFFLAVAMSALFVAPLAHPAPHDMRIGIAGDQHQAAELQTQLDHAVAGGFQVVPLTETNVADAVRDDDVAAAVLPGTDPVVLVASDTGATRVEFLEKFLPDVIDPTFKDIDPSPAGDATGTGVFFYALPIAVVGMVSAIVLLQLGAWTFRRKMAAVTVIAMFTAVVTYAIAVWQEVVPLTGSSALIMIGTFVFVQGLGWTLTGAAPFVRQFLVPIALTFVLVLGVPTAGAPATHDMLPTALGRLHEIMPLGQFITLVRSLASGVGSPLHPSIVLATWLVIGAILIQLAAAHSRRGAAVPHTHGANAALAHLHGTVTSLSDAPVPHASVWVLNEQDDSVLRTTTDASGHYSLDDVPEGTHHILVTARQAEPEIITVSVHAQNDRAHDFALQQWDDPAGNLVAESAGERER
ncbi:carboxypeptidase-like regulatory domain-containing protein [Streptomyces solaniscabiei]|uniref:carboxypeptidase-like regulatory domain-containing protein n=1 Tax=Streptomyces solaniscabiei TaxID=2683255 RepID=UPI001CE3B192|nr:carboxypeptidase-like regulatory domain-containing protein [Streptomyces solaniscabiei]